MRPAPVPLLPRRPARAPGPPARSRRARAGARSIRGPSAGPFAGVVLAGAVLAALPVAAPPGAADERPRGTWPLIPRPVVAARFDPPDSTWGAGHRGVDLAAHPVATVRSALPGTVRFTGTIAGRGVVVVGHGATRTTYEPVRATVSVGDRVAAGQPIGLLEVAGSHCFPAACLHWGWLRGETYLDPLLLVGAAPVRLLPTGGVTPASSAAPRSSMPPALPIAAGAGLGGRQGHSPG